MSILTDRQQRVVFKEQSSNWKIVGIRKFIYVEAYVLILNNLLIHHNFQWMIKLVSLHVNLKTI